MLASLLKAFLLLEKKTWLHALFPLANDEAAQ